MSRTDAAGAVLVPVKSFELAKQRLNGALDAQARADLARDMATHVVNAQVGLPVAVACDDTSVADWARSVGADVIWCPGTDLNGAVSIGFAELGRAGFDQVAVAHSDLPLATSFAALFGWPGVTLVPDRHRTGTNVLIVPCDLDFNYSYGVGSLARHVAEAVRHRRGLRIVHHPGLSWDVDQPDDLHHPGPADEPGSDLLRRYRS